MAEPTAPVGVAVKKVGGIFGKAPKWAWIASAGIAGGIIYMRHRKTNTVQDASAPTDATAPGDTGQTGQAFTAGYVDTPYSSSPTQDQSSNQDVPGLISAIGGLIQAPPDVAGAITDSNAALIGALAPLLGGGAPLSTTTQAAPAPVNTPAPTSKPVSTAKPCPAKYPFRSDRGCYQVVISDGKGSRSKGRWHVYDPADHVPDQKVA